MEEKKILSAPKYGWAKIEIEDKVFYASYLTNIPFDLLTEFMAYLKTGKMPMIIIDGEDAGEAVLIFDKDEIRLVCETEEGKDVKIEKIDIKEAIRKITEEIKENIDEWSEFYYLMSEENPIELEGNRYQMTSMINFILQI